MSKTQTPVSRRVFMKNTAALSILAGIGNAPRRFIKTSQSKSKKRIVLQEAGPMLPPVPAILLTVSGKPNEPDEISVVWTFVINGKPPQVGISADLKHVANKLVDLHGEFVLNVPTIEIVEAFDKVDMNSHDVKDKFVLSGLTRGKAVKVDAPTVEESPIHVECKVFNKIEVPPTRTVYLAEVVATTVHEGACDENGRLVVANVPFFGMIAGSGEFYTMGKRVGHIGMTVGREDIKY